ncbi:MAG: hypothetical protein JNL97_03025 [Verrucomicrobiales bacterium]|nr:hypothetical protein [Verrucomicrobiales bacterium]
MLFPSREFDDAVAAVCDGSATEEQLRALGDRLRGDAAARDEYLRRLALHAYLASEPGLFASSVPAIAGIEETTPACRVRSSDGPPASRGAEGFPARTWRWAWAVGLAACLGLLAWFGWGEALRRRDGERSRAVAMLNRVVNARWNDSVPLPKLGAPLEPGRLVLDSGLAQIVFYTGARVVVEGPTELRLVSSDEAVCVRGKLTAEVPPPARGFRIVSPRLEVTDLGTSFGLGVYEDRSELHVFEGRAAFRTGRETAEHELTEGMAALVDGSGHARRFAADRSGFAELFALQAKSVAADARRYDRWRGSVSELRRDPSLWVHLDFEHGGGPVWRLPNLGSRTDAIPDATIVGCDWREGRWATKPALEFRGLGDRLRLSVPGEFESMTLAAWVRVQGLNRTINSLFMSDGFAPGTLHWVIRDDGVLGLTVIGDTGGHQIVASPPVITADHLGVWTHLAVVLDGPGREVVHYLDGREVSRHPLRSPPPFRFEAAELGNWNAHGFSGNDPFLLRNFSGSMDEFCLFARALSPEEIDSLHTDGKPQPETPVASAGRFPKSSSRTPRLDTRILP